jgi:hypothetical protein
VLAILFFALTFDGCHFADPDRVGLTLNGDGTVRAVIPSCAAQLVHVIVLSSVGDDGSERILWDVKTSSEPHLDQFTVGVAPDGFETRVPFDGKWPGGKARLDVYASRSHYQPDPNLSPELNSTLSDGFIGSTVAVDFERVDVHFGDVLINGKHVSGDRVDALGCRDKYSN